MPDVITRTSLGVRLVVAAVVLTAFVPSASPTFALQPSGSTGHQDSEVEAPQLYFRSNLATVTVHAHESFRIDPGWVSVPPEETVPEQDLYEVQLSRTPMRAAHRSPWQTSWHLTAQRRQQVTLGQGQVVCVRVRQHSGELRSAWTEPECMVRAVDDSRVHHRGATARVADDHYEDGHATYVRPGGRLVLPGVGRGARYGAVFTYYPLDHPKWCVHPDIYLAGQRRPRGYTGAAAHRIEYIYSTARAPGTATYGPMDHSACNVGGVVIQPRWAL